MYGLLDGSADLGELSTTVDSEDVAVFAPVKLGRLVV